MEISEKKLKKVFPGSKLSEETSVPGFLRIKIVLRSCKVNEKNTSDPGDDLDRFRDLCR